MTRILGTVLLIGCLFAASAAPAASANPEVVTATGPTDADQLARPRARSTGWRSWVP
jgi:hypothetical protein